MIKYLIITLLLTFVSPPIRAQYSFSFLELSDNMSSKQSSFWSGGVHGDLFYSLDVDDDGKMDIVSYERTSNRIRTYITVDNKPMYTPEYEKYFPKDIANWVIITDLNHDGTTNLLTNSDLGIKVYEIIKESDGFSWIPVASPLFYSNENSSKKVNMLVSPHDVPAVADVDFDGDEDILFYNNSSSYISFFENKQNYGKYTFELSESQWGDFRECDCDSFSFANEICNGHSNPVIQHLGGKSLYLYDVDSDGDLDVYTGQEECSQVYFLENKGNSETPKFDSFRSVLESENSISFPVVSVLNFNNEKHLLIADHEEVNQNTSNLFDYKLGTNALLELSQSSIFGNSIFDLGAWTAPLFYDMDKDGDQDLLLGYRPIPSAVNKSESARVAYYENIGNEYSPRFRLKSSDFMNFSTNNWYYILPTIYSNRLILNVFDPLSLNASLFQVNLETSKLTELSIANLQFSDQISFSSDTLYLAKALGRLDLYRTSQNENNINFKLLEQDVIPRNKLGQHNLSILRNEKDFIVLSNDGKLKEVSFDNQTIEVNEFEILETQDYAFSSKNFLAKANLWKGEISTVVVGSVEGGLWVLRPKAKSPSEFYVYPNPVKNKLFVHGIGEGSVCKIFDIKGNLVMKEGLMSSPALDVSELSMGVYILQCFFNGKIRTVKFLKKD